MLPERRPTDGRTRYFIYKIAWGALEAAGTHGCAKCELWESKKKASCARWQERWRPRLYLNYLEAGPVLP